MRRKSSKQLFSVLMAATMVMSGISIPVNASQVDDAVVRSVLTKTEQRHLKVGKSISTKAGSSTTEM